jgi:hypothetical protein
MSNDRSELHVEIERLQQVLLEFIRVVNECDTVCAVGSPCLCAIEHQMWLEKEQPKTC